MTPFSRLFLVGAAAACLCSPSSAADQPNPSFTLIGHVESLSLDGSGPRAAARIRVSGIDVILPQNLLITLPGRYMTPEDLFHGPTAGSGTQARTGLALDDASPPRVPFEAEVIGNIVGASYVAGVVRVSQGALHAGAGFIQQIDMATGEMRIGALGGTTGARVRLNDPTGIYGLANGEGAKAAIPLDARFALDPDNSPVHAKTGFPVCVPRNGADPKCPTTNRPGNAKRFTCARVGGASASPDAPARPCDPDRPVPLQVGDYVTYLGILQTAAPNGIVIAAYGLDAELGVYTSPGSEPVYVFVEEAIQGTKGEPFEGVPQEETTRFRIVGFTTDPSRSVEIKLVDSDRGGVGTSFSGPGGLAPSNGPQLGRFRNTWPSKDDARAVRRDALVQVVGSPHATTPAGLTSGTYVSPVGEYIYPEPTTFGVSGFPTPVPFENFCFLAKGGGTFNALGGPITLAKLSPFPESGHALSQPVGTGPRRACDEP